MNLSKEQFNAIASVYETDPATFPKVRRGITYSGLASAFNHEVETQKGITVMNPTAFNKTIKDWELSGKRRYIPVLWNHNTSLVPVGIVTDLYADPYRGLIFSYWSDDYDEIDLSIGRKVRDGIVRNVSIGFESINEKLNQQFPSGNRGRIIYEAKLYEISLVVFGADSLARIERIGTKDLYPVSPEQKERAQMQRESRFQFYSGENSEEIVRKRHNARLKYIAELHKKVTKDLQEH